MSSRTNSLVASVSVLSWVSGLWMRLLPSDLPPPAALPGPLGASAAGSELPGWTPLAVCAALVLVSVIYRRRHREAAPPSSMAADAGDPVPGSGIPLTHPPLIRMLAGAFR